MTPTQGNGESTHKVELAEANTPPAQITYNPTYQAVYEGADPTRGCVYNLAARPSDTLAAERMREALTKIAEGNLGDAPWQADYAVIQKIARTALFPISTDGGEA